MTIPGNPELLKTLRAKRCIRGRGSLGGFAYAVDGCVPYIATAIHAGSNVRKELLPLMKIDTPGRYFEEDPETDAMIQGADSAVWGLDSRSEYDLNRPPADALPLTPQQFWGIQVYLKQPSQSMNLASLAKYDQFYAFMGSWAAATLEKFGVCLVYDLHAYNITRQVQKGIAAPPVFNLGTTAIDRRRWRTPIDDWLNRLNDITIPGIETTVAENLVFMGTGELCRRLTEWDPRILVLSTEVSKIYMDEKKGRVDPAAVDALREGLGKSMHAHSRTFLRAWKDSYSTSAFP